MKRWGRWLGAGIAAAGLGLGWAGLGLAASGGLIPNGQQQFVDSNGSPFAGGSVCFYIPGTSTPSLTYQDPGLTVPNTSPCVTLNSAGRAIIWGSGSFRQILYDLNGVLIWDQLVSGGVTPGSIIPDPNFSGTVTFPDSSTWSSLGLIPRGNPIPESALGQIPTSTYLGNVSGAPADVQALSICFPETFTETSGSGTFTLPLCNGQLPQQLHVRLLGGGGGGGGSGNGSTGGTTSFSGTAAGVPVTLTGLGGGGGSSTGLGGAGGGTSGGSISLAGAPGGSTPGSFSGSPTVTGANGAPGVFGGGGGPNIAAGPNSGAGGGGLGGSGSSAGGGGAGGYVEAWLTGTPPNTLSASFSFSIGAGGAAGTGGAGAGGSGIIIITAQWQ